MAPEGQPPEEGKPDEQLEARRLRASDDGFMKYAAEEQEPEEDEGLERRRLEAANDAFMRYDDATDSVQPAATEQEEGTMRTCEACGNPLTTETPKAAMTEAARPAAGGNERKLAESEREELCRLRIGERERQKEARAVKAISDAGLSDIVETGDLTPFHEAQWPTLLNRLFTQGQRAYNGGERDMPATRQREARPHGKSAGELFKEAWEGGSE